MKLLSRSARTVESRLYSQVEELDLQCEQIVAEFKAVNSDTSIFRSTL
jgi:hypothetical protein